MLRISASSAARRERMKPVRLAAAPDEQPVGEGAALGQKALELQGAPSAREGAAVDRGEAGGVARVQRRDPHGSVARPLKPGEKPVHRRGSRA